MSNNASLSSNNTIANNKTSQTHSNFTNNTSNSNNTTSTNSNNHSFTNNMSKNITNNPSSHTTLATLHIADFTFDVLECSISQQLGSLCDAEIIAIYEGLNPPLSNNKTPFNFIDTNALLCLYPNHIHKANNISLSSTRPNTSHMDTNHSNVNHQTTATKNLQGVITHYSFKGEITSAQKITSLNTLSSKHSIPLGKTYLFAFHFSSSLIRLSYNTHYRIFNHISPLQLITTLLYENQQLLNIAIDTSLVDIKHYQPQEYITQYKESNLNFLLRLCSMCGVMFKEIDDKIIIYDEAFINALKAASLSNNTNSNTPHSQALTTSNNTTNTNQTNTNPHTNPSHKDISHLDNNVLNNTSNTHVDANTAQSAHLDAHSRTQDSSLYIYPLSQDIKTHHISSIISKHTMNATNKELTINSSYYPFNPQAHSIYPNTTSHPSYIYHHYYTQGYTESKQSHSTQELLDSYSHPSYIIESTSNIEHLCIGDNILIVSPKQMQILEQQGYKQGKQNISHTKIQQLLTSLKQDNPLLAKTYKIIAITHHIQNKAKLGESIESALDSSLDSISLSHSNTAQESNMLHQTHINSYKPNTSNKHMLNTNHHISTYSNTLILLPIETPYILPPIPKPQALFQDRAIVIGKEIPHRTNTNNAKLSIASLLQNEINTIHTDNLGRVRVIFDFAFTEALIAQSHTNSANTKSSNQLDSAQDLQTSKQSQDSRLDSQDLHANNKDSHSHTNLDSDVDAKHSLHSLSSLHSCYLQVASPIASFSSGFYALPRVGDEVIISYMQGDIDKPFIIGAFYNTHNQPLTPIDNLSQTSISARTLGKDEVGINELTLSNIKDKEQIYLHAQKDYDEVIESNFTQNIHNNKDSQVKGSYTESINKYHKQEILGMKDVRVGAEYLTNVALSKDTIVGGSNTLNVGIDNKLRVANNSSEYIGGDKDTTIQGTLRESINGDKSESVRGNKSEVVEGTIDIQSTKEYSISTQSQMNVNAKDNILFSTQESSSFESQKVLSFIADNTDIESKSDLTAVAGNQMSFTIGETTITATNNKIILKAGGVEATLDSNGLVVKGGEVKSE